MKSIKTKKQVLNNHLLEEDFFEDTLLIGIVSMAPSYKFVWQLNQYLSYQFVRNHEYEVEVNDTYFEVYQYIEAEKLLEHIVYTNRKKTNFLLDELRNIDYVWMIKGPYLNSELSNQLILILQKLPLIDYCALLQPAQLKSKRHLIL